MTSRSNIIYAITLALQLLSLVECQLHFASIGNWGYDAKEQAVVGSTLKAQAPKDHISFIVSPGSNFAEGITGLNDTRWKTQFGDPYCSKDGELKMPFFSVLGAEDWSGNYTAQIQKTRMQYNTTDVSGCPQWTIPNWWYYYITRFADNYGGSVIHSGRQDVSVGVVFIDTWIMSDMFPFHAISKSSWKQLDLLLSKLEGLVDWIIVVGDKAVYSSGPSKGDGQLRKKLNPMLSKYNVDTYISGYDLDMEAIKPDAKNGPTYINCGTGSMRGEATITKDANSMFYTVSPGYCVHTLTKSKMTTKFVNGNTGAILHSFEQQNVPKSQPKSIANFQSLPEVFHVQVPYIARMPSADVFVKVVGTLGISIGVALATITTTAGVSKLTK